MSLAHVVAYTALGVGVGTIGTLMGAGGGFVLIPILLFLHPSEPAANVTAISLAVVFANALSGSSAYAYQRRVDWRSGLLFALAGFPGSIVGAWLTNFIDRRLFDPLLGATLILGAILVLTRRPAQAGPDPAAATRTLVERDGT